MKNFLPFLFSFLAVVFFTGCVHNPVPAAISFVDHSGTGTHPVNDTVQALKRGESSCHQILLLVSFGDCTIDTARKKGDIEKIHSVDYSSTQVLYIYGEYTTIVHGE